MEGFWKVDLDSLMTKKSKEKYVGLMMHDMAKPNWNQSVEKSAPNQG